MPMSLHAQSRKFLNLSKGIQSYCEPFFKGTGISYCDFARIYNDGSVHPLWSNLGWADCFLFSDFALPSVECYPDSTFMLWQGIEDLQIHDHQLKVAAEEFSLGHGICIIQKHQDYIDMYNFCGSIDEPGLVNFYFMNFANITNFIRRSQSFFEQQIMQENSKADIILRPAPHKIQNPVSPRCFEPDASYRFKISINNRLISLTQREAQCIQYLLQNNTAKQIGASLGISHRTVEVNLENIKKKVDVNSIGRLKQLLCHQSFFFH